MYAAYSAAFAASGPPPTPRIYELSLYLPSLNCLISMYPF